MAGERDGMSWLPSIARSDTSGRLQGQFLGGQIHKLCAPRRGDSLNRPQGLAHTVLLLHLQSGLVLTYVRVRTYKERLCTYDLTLKAAEVNPEHL